MTTLECKAGVALYHTLEKVKGFSASSSPLLSEGGVEGAAMAVATMRPRTILLKKCIVADLPELMKVASMLSVGRVKEVNR